MPIDYLKKILTAKVYDVAIETPLHHAPLLSERLGQTILLKREDLQPVYSYKLRGAYNKMAHLPPARLKRGVIAASAGNHAQGVALAAQKLNVKATIVMPITTPQIKIDAVARRGGKVLLHGVSYDDAYTEAKRLARSRKLTFVHPYDDPDVIAGQGTIAMEILQQHQGPIHAIFVPIGGGGAISGIAAYIKRVRPEIKIIGVEPADAASMYQSLKAKKRVTLPHVGLFADGTAVKQVGKEPFRLARQYVDDILLADTDAICAALKDVFEDTRAILEPSGALAIAGVKQYCARHKLRGQTMIALASGANMNFDRLRFVAERAELGEQREAIFAATIPEKPGSFRKFCALLGSRQITEFNYRYGHDREAHVFVGVTVRSKDEVSKLFATMRRNGIAIIDLRGNEMAKLHIRHLAGGRAPTANEMLYRFEFPERPGALRNFLGTMGGNWNISLFHYRNHGADYGRVLAGVQVPPRDRKAWQKFLHRVGYPCVDETRNPAYKLFLR